ncbi:hypothetical protein LJC01_03560 [Clostridiaceae bacterium OttesenSCG-928-D20]|nr:hypothetical protein [Clostridiaceae bacterium OttesenSCG-928-D20]
MGKSMEMSKDVVETGYWNMFRYDPRLELEGKNPLAIDSKAPSKDYREQLMNEVRYSSLTLSFPERADELFAIAEKDAKERYEKLVSQKEMFDK